MPLDLTQLVQDCHAYTLNQGFWSVSEGSQVVPAKLMLIVSEAAEAMEANRELRSMDEELADIIIRVCYLAGAMNIDLNLAVQNKRAYNKTRPRMHGKRY
jgi:NTP pyrophosphatase (non-canonical NTP hydrolase)